MPQIYLGFFFALLMAGGGYALKSLSRSGAFAALFVGTAVFGMGGPLWGLLLVAFFVSASALSEWREEDKMEPAEQFEKGKRRDAGQVLANGGLLAGLALLQALLAARPDLLPFHLDLLPAAIGALAAVTADTWATEVGLLAAMRPRLITTGEPVPPGTSGGITIIGTTAAIAGGAFIGMIAALFIALAGSLAMRSFEIGLLDLSGMRFVLLAPVAGLASAAFDSYLGATQQAIYRDGRGQETEHPTDPNGQPLEKIRGRRWMNNDLVNLLASALGALLTLLLDLALFS